MSDELVLHDAVQSGNAYKVRLLLAQLQRAYRRVQVEVIAGEARTPEFKQKNPFGRVPFITEGDFHLSESNAILIYLARGSALLPEAPRVAAKVHQWLCFEQSEIQPTLVVSRFIKRFAPTSPGAAETLLTQRRRGESALKVLERHLSTHQFLVNEAYSIADIALFGYVPLADEGGFSLDDCPGIRAWVQRVSATERFVPMSLLGS